MICPKCQSENPTDANFCQNCGYRFEEGVTDSKEHEKDTGTPIVKEKGEEIKESPESQDESKENTDSSIGMEVPKEQPSNNKENSSEPSPKKTHKFAKILIAVAVTVLALGGSWYGFQQKKLADTRAEEQAKQKADQKLQQQLQKQMDVALKDIPEVSIKTVEVPTDVTTYSKDSTVKVILSYPDAKKYDLYYQKPDTTDYSLLASSYQNQEESVQEKVQGEYTVELSLLTIAKLEKNDYQLMLGRALVLPKELNYDGKKDGQPVANVPGESKDAPNQIQVSLEKDNQQVTDVISQQNLTYQPKDQGISEDDVQTQRDGMLLQAAKINADEYSMQDFVNLLADQKDSQEESVNSRVPYIFKGVPKLKAEKTDITYDLENLGKYDIYERKFYGKTSAEHKYSGTAEGKVFYKEAYINDGRLDEPILIQHTGYYYDMQWPSEVSKSDQFNSDESRTTTAVNEDFAEGIKKLETESNFYLSFNDKEDIFTGYFVGKDRLQWGDKEYYSFSPAYLTKLHLPPDGSEVGLATADNTTNKLTASSGASDDEKSSSISSETPQTSTTSIKDWNDEELDRWLLGHYRKKLTGGSGTWSQSANGRRNDDDTYVCTVLEGTPVFSQVIFKNSGTYSIEENGDYKFVWFGDWDNEITGNIFKEYSFEELKSVRNDVQNTHIPSLTVEELYKISASDYDNAEMISNFEDTDFIGIGINTPNNSTTVRVNKISGQVETGQQQYQYNWELTKKLWEYWENR